MRRTYLQIGILCIVIGVVFVTEGCKQKHSTSDHKSDTDSLTLVAKYEPLHLYIYAAATNNIPDLTVREGDDPVYIRENDSNGIVVRQFEKYE